MGRSSTRGRGTGRRESGSGGRREMREMGSEFGAVANAFGGMSMGDSTATFGWGDASSGTGFDGFNYGECRYCGTNQSDHLPTDCPKKSKLKVLSGRSATHFSDSNCAAVAIVFLANMSSRTFAFQ